MIHGVHLIWTTYGTWLPGDERGHWSPLFTLYGRVRESGGKLNPPDSTTKARVVSTMTEPPKWLMAEEMRTIAEELGRLLAPPNPPVWAAAIEPNHVHLLLGRVEEDLSRFTGRLKGRTSSVVGALAMNEDRQRVWTSGFWKVFLFDDSAARAVKSDIEAHNLRRNLPAAPFPWITPYETLAAGLPAGDLATGEPVASTIRQASESGDIDRPHGG